MDVFFAKHPVFRTEELRRFQTERGTTGARAAESLVRYYVKAGRLIRVKRGLYAVVRRGNDVETFTPDLFLVAARMTDDAVLAHHTALEFHGHAYSVFERLSYATAYSMRPVTFRGWMFQPVAIPNSLRDKGRAEYGVNVEERIGMDIRVASLERTLVDVLDRPILSGSWEEIWRSLESVAFFDLDRVVEYTVTLENATTAARVGFFLDTHRDTLMVENKHLAPLRSLRPRQPQYFNWNRERGGRFVKAWNLIVPEEVLFQSWAEVI